MFHRRLVLLIGERAWAEGVTNATLVKLPTSGKKLRVLRADLRDPPARAWMGQELDLVVLTAHRRGFLDTFGAVAGTLKAGGVLFFHTPPWEVWNQERLGARWCKLLTSLCNDPKIGEFITVCKEEDGCSQVQERIDSMDSLNSNQLHPNVLTPNAEQKALIQKVLKIKSSRPLLIFGRRGRGKSASLGMAAAVLLQRGCRIVVTSPSKEATSQLFWSAEMFLGGALPRNLTSQKAGIDFVDPQVLVRGHYDLRETFLIVDEAAGFPVNFTVELLQKAGRVLLATTLDGYEGSGNGFLVRAVPRLRRWRKGLQIQELTTSWRWTEGCPLEALARSAMLLDAAPATLRSQHRETVAQEAQVERVEREKLQEEELKKLYGLLRIGHYKTKPSDLETFLDAKGIIWLSLKSADQHVGLTISGIEEPVEDAAKAEELWLGRRQVPQNLSAQILSRDAGILEASQLRFVRMMRWCLHPELRGYGLGERLLEQSLVHLKMEKNVDAVAAHFGATSWLMKLWLRHAFIVFVSHNCDPSSGQHSVSVLIPLSDAAEKLVRRLQRRLVLQIFDLLCGPLSDLDGDAVKELLKALPLQEVDLETISDAWSFAFGARALSHCKHGLCRTVYRALMCARTCGLPKKEEEVLLALLQGRPIRSQDQLRQIVRKLLSTSRPE